VYNINVGHSILERGVRWLWKTENLYPYGSLCPNGCPTRLKMWNCDGKAVIIYEEETE